MCEDISRELFWDLVCTKPRRGEKFSGGEFLGRGIFPRQFGRGGFGGENLKIFPAGGGMARIL